MIIQKYLKDRIYPVSYSVKSDSEININQDNINENFILSKNGGGIKWLN